MKETNRSSWIILLSGREPKQIFKGGPKKKMQNVKIEVQADTWNTEDLVTLLHRTVQFYTPRPTPRTKEYQPRLIRSPTDHDIGKQNPERNGKKKTPRPLA